MNDQSDILEMSVLGGLMLDSSKLMDIDLSVEHFNNKSYAQVFQAVTDLSLAGEHIDMITVSDHLARTTGKNWLPLVGHLATKTPTAYNVASYAKTVRKNAAIREAITIAEGLIQTVETEDQDAIDNAIRDLMAINVCRRNYEFSAAQAATSAMEHIDHVAQNGITGIPTGLTDLDEKMGGLHESDLIIVGARPAMGKTAFMLNLANASNVPCGITSGEQGHDQIGLRLVSVNGNVNAHNLRLAKLDDSDWSRITKALSTLENKQIWIYDKPGPTINDVVRQARKWKHERNIRVLFVDYVQRIRAKGESRRDEVAVVVQTLKELARELDIPVVALAQVNRKVEDRPNKRPLLSDLKEAGEIEQEADIVMTLYRDEVYNPDTTAQGIVEIGIAKNRHGPTGIIRCSWVDRFMRFQDISAPQYWGDQ